MPPQQLLDDAVSVLFATALGAVALVNLALWAHSLWRQRMTTTHSSPRHQALGPTRREAQTMRYALYTWILAAALAGAGILIFGA